MVAARKSCSKLSALLRTCVRLLAGADRIAVSDADGLRIEVGWRIQASVTTWLHVIPRSTFRMLSLICGVYKWCKYKSDIYSDPNMAQALVGDPLLPRIEFPANTCHVGFTVSKVKLRELWRIQWPYRSGDCRLLTTNTWVHTFCSPCMAHAAESDFGRIWPSILISVCQCHVGRDIAVLGDGQ